MSASRRPARATPTAVSRKPDESYESLRWVVVRGTATPIVVNLPDDTWPPLRLCPCGPPPTAARPQPGRPRGKPVHEGARLCPMRRSPNI
jgi:hypothetical protein